MKGDAAGGKDYYLYHPKRQDSAGDERNTLIHRSLIRLLLFNYQSADFSLIGYASVST